MACKHARWGISTVQEWHAVPRLQGSWWCTRWLCLGQPLSQPQVCCTGPRLPGQWGWGRMGVWSDYGATTKLVVAGHHTAESVPLVLALTQRGAMHPTG